MALIKCPECKKKISDQCKDCPNCGFPIKSSLGENVAEDTAKVVGLNVNDKKLFYKQKWFWATVGVVIVAIVVVIVLYINRDTKPKCDKNGNPQFVEFTSEVYTNADEYLGYFVNVKGKVFQVMGDDGNTKGIQIWVDPDACEHNLMVYYDSDVDVKQGDYIVCTAYIDSVTKYKNAYGAELEVPLVYSSDLRKATYMEVMAPATDEWFFDNLKHENIGYSISIDKVEFSRIETRVYVTVTNNGKATLNVADTIVVQNGRQFNSQNNYEADYESIPYEIVTGVSCSGIIVFPVLCTEEFTISLDVYSDEIDEELGAFVFNVSRENVDIQNGQQTQPNNTFIGEQPNINQNEMDSSQMIDGSVTSEETVVIEQELVESEDNEEILEMPVQSSGTINNRSEEAINTAIEIAYYDYEATPVEVEKRLINEYGFSHEDAKYCVGEIGNSDLEGSKYNWTERVECYVTDRLDYYIEYTWCDECGEVYGVYHIGENCPICGMVVITSTNSTLGYTKEEVIKKLKEEGFANVDIENGLSVFSDEYFYDESRYKKP